MRTAATLLSLAAAASPALAAASSSAFELDGAASKIVFDNGEASQLDVTADYLRGLASKVASLEAGKATADGKIAALESGKATADGKIAALESGKATSDGKIAALESGKATADGKIAALESGKTTSDGKIAALESGKATADGKIAALESGKTTSDGKIAALESGKATADGKIAALETGKASCESRLDALEAALASANAKIAAVEAAAVVPGEMASNPANSCLEIKQAKPNALSGQYYLKNGAGGTWAAECDMTADGGGWTKLMSANHPHWFTSGNWADYNAGNPTHDNYSQLKYRGLFKRNGKYEFRLQIARSGQYSSKSPDHMVAWRQPHDPFTETTAGGGYELVAGTGPTTCGGFNGLHNKYTGHSFTCDPDTNDGNGCWWMQVAPHTQWGSSTYLDGFGGGGHFHKWQVMWVR